jgi:quercetin dioxygenase-like cupin family protein
LEWIGETTVQPSPDQPVTRDIVLDARFDRAKATARVEVRRIRMLRGHPGGLHVHNTPVVGNIVSGSVIYQIEGEPEHVLVAGDVFFEPQDVRIARFDAQEDGVEFLGYFLIGEGEEASLTVPQDPAAA